MMQPHRTNWGHFNFRALTSDLTVDQLPLDMATVTQTIAAAPCCRHVVLWGHKTQIEKDMKFNFFPSLSKADSLHVTLGAVAAWSVTMQHAWHMLVQNELNPDEAWMKRWPSFNFGSVSSRTASRNLRRRTRRSKSSSARRRWSIRRQRRPTRPPTVLNDVFTFVSGHSYWSVLVTGAVQGKASAERKAKKEPARTQTTGKGDKRGGQRGLEEGSLHLQASMIKG